MNIKNVLQDPLKSANTTANYNTVTPKTAKKLLLAGGGLEWLKKPGNCRCIERIAERLYRNAAYADDFLVSIDENKRILKGHEYLFAVFETKISCVMKIELVAA